MIQPAYEKDSAQYNSYVSALDNAGIIPLSLNETMSFTLGSILFTIYPPEKTHYHKENNYSLVISVQHGENSFLFTGDAMAKRLKELLAMDNLEHSFLKVPHHGNFNKRSDEFFQAVSAKYAVITCSDDLPASDKVIEALKRAGTKVYFTTDGSVTCISNGISLQIQQNK